MAPREVYRSAWPGVNNAAQARFGKPFVQLDGGQRDQLIVALEQGALDIGAVPPKVCFGQLLANTTSSIAAWYTRPIPTPPATRWLRCLD